MDEDGTSLWITVDSGASENVVSEPCLPLVLMAPSKGSTEDVRYLAADSNSMPNRGEKAVRIVTEEGHRCSLSMQVTDVKRLLMSVSRICDAGHSAADTRNGGVIRHLASGQETRLHRVGNVFSLKARGHGEDSGFSTRGG